MTLVTRKPYGKPMAFLLLSLAATTALGQQSPEDSAGTVPPGYSTTVTGGVHDFDYFMGSGWVTQQRRLKDTGVGSNDWQAFSATLCATPYLDGTATVDEMYMPSRKMSGMTIRTFDPATHQWSIYWVTSRTGKLDSSVMKGGFSGNLGQFYAEDHDQHGRPIKVRFLWKIIDHDHARWEQAFSYDNRSWETNWTSDFTRADRDKVCVDGRPKH
jgi:hypothetical protein